MINEYAALQAENEHLTTLNTELENKIFEEGVIWTTKGTQLARPISESSKSIATQLDRTIIEISKLRHEVDQQQADITNIPAWIDHYMTQKQQVAQHLSQIRLQDAQQEAALNSLNIKKEGAIRSRDNEKYEVEKRRARKDEIRRGCLPGGRFAYLGISL